MTSRWVLAAGSLVLSLLLAEGAARVLFPAPEGRGNFTPIPRSLKRASGLPGVPYLLRPNFEVVQLFHTDPDGYFGADASLHYRTNSQGFRGPDFATEKAPGVLRVLVLGDSFTFGTGVREQDSFVAVLRSRIGSERIEVLNLGMMGFDTVAEVNLLRQHALDFEPDLVLFVLFLNDAGGGGAQQAFNAAAPAWEVPFWRRGLRSVDRVMAFVERRRALADLVASYDESFAADSVGWLDARRSLTETRDLAAASGFRMALVVFPVLWQLSDDYPFAESHRRIAAFAAEIDVPLLDLLPAFAGYAGPELWAHPSNQHPNARAHAIAAGAIHDFLLDEALIGER